MDERAGENKPGALWLTCVLFLLFFIAIYVTDYLHRAGSLPTPLFGILTVGLFILIIVGVLAVHFENP